MESPDSIESIVSKNEQLTLELKAKNSQIQELTDKVASLELRVKSLELENKLLKVKVESLAETDLVSDVKNAASQVAKEQFLESMAYEETSGLYYDYKTGYYYDAQRSLYYDGHNGIYYTYNYDTKAYEVHSQVPQKPEKKAAKKRQRSNSATAASAEKSPEKSEAPPLSYSAPASPYGATEDVESEEGEILSDVDEGEEAVAPCIRLVVTKSNDEKLGSLFVVTCTGGSVGREGDHDVLIENEVGCSKRHAKFSYDNGKYFVEDLESRNGTFVNEKRLKRATEVGHGSRLQIGNTVLVCHVHPGRETCLECEPGLVQEAKKTEVGSTQKSRKLHAKELRRLKSKFGLKRSNDGVTNFNDRSAARRLEKGSDNPYEKTEAANLETAIESSNKGFKMLSKMGWKEGEGLGVDSNKGRTDPIPVAGNLERSGLGHSGSVQPVSDKKDKVKAEIWLKTQKRFQSIDEK